MWERRGAYGVVVVGGGQLKRKSALINIGLDWRILVKQVFKK
jgi:hypothetical protein